MQLCGSLAGNSCQRNSVCSCHVRSSSPFHYRARRMDAFGTLCLGLLRLNLWQRPWCSWPLAAPAGRWWLSTRLGARQLPQSTHFRRSFLGGLGDLPWPHAPRGQRAGTGRHSQAQLGPTSRAGCSLVWAGLRYAAGRRHTPRSLAASSQQPTACCVRETDRQRNARPRPRTTVRVVSPPRPRFRATLAAEGGKAGTRPKNDPVLRGLCATSRPHTYLLTLYLIFNVRACPRGG